MDSELSIAPAVHPATSALYIRDLIRPINASQLHSHLTSLATHPDVSPSESASLLTLHVDALRTHALAKFASPKHASRVRTSLHSRVWPPEPTRRPLWVDFIPAEKVSDWIAQEQASSGSRPSQAKRWEVRYNVSASGPVTAEFVEVDPKGPSGTMAPPLGPRNSNHNHHQHTDSASGDPPPNTISVTKPAAVESASFLELDALFRSTAQKPKIYFQPVKAEIAERRLDEIDARTARDWDARADAVRNRGFVNGRAGLDQLRRYTFEDGDVLVDGGPEYGGGRAFGADRGGYGGGRGGGGYGGGGYRGDRYRG